MCCRTMIILLLAISKWVGLKGLYDLSLVHLCIVDIFGILVIFKTLRVHNTSVSHPQGPEVPFTYKFLQSTFDNSRHCFGLWGIQ